MKISRIHSRGFTLIELMIVVVVMAILLAVAIPAYNDQVLKTRRADAQSEMMQQVQALERHHTVRNTYAGFAIPAGTGGPHYDITVGGLSATAFLITATPQGGQASERCGTLTINQANVRTVSTGVDLDQCWP